MSDFARRLIDWHRDHGRHDLPWQGSRDPYRIWLSEIMLQQTQVSSVIPYYTRFLERFPDVATLAASPVEDVMALWSGLGYYARARNLHRAAQQVMQAHDGRFPDCSASLITLPGIGRSTAAAIAAFSSGERVAILDGNVKRVLCRVFGIEGFPGEKAVENRLWTLAESLLPDTELGTYTQAQMDLGATVCTRGKPACMRCPMAEACVAARSGRTRELPAARPRKTIPRRSTQLAVVVCNGRVLVERRPPSGIWGGLLALPELPGTGTTLPAWAFGDWSAGQTPVALPPLTHTFTHFVLDIQPWRIDLTHPPAQLAEPAHQWLALDQLADAALPTPIRQILTRLQHPDLFD